MVSIERVWDRAIEFAGEWGREADTDDLSGQWAGSVTPQDLLHETMVHLGVTQEQYEAWDADKLAALTDDVCGAYQDAWADANPDDVGADVDPDEAFRLRPVREA